ncbi:hypothetical protein EDB89DRAFT_2062053 [Lactarius sanguifluus]|nr:hypothetical protein EDB89DRAFT_2062053 [Lactarius sanguifluus]
MIHHHTFLPLPIAAPFASFSHLDQWTPSWPDVYVFSKSDSRLSRPHPYSSRRRPPYPRLEPTSGLSPRSPRTGAQPVLRTQVPPMLSALPIPVATPGLEPSPSSNPGSPMSTAAPPTPAPEFLQVVCNAPLLAPKPLPYRPPAFLDSFELPDPDEDLSRPPLHAIEFQEEAYTYTGRDRTTLLWFQSAAPQSTVFRGLNGLGSHRRFSK